MARQPVESGPFWLRALFVAGASLLVLPGARCGGGGAPPGIQILSPAHGTFTTAGSLTVTGRVVNLPPSHASVTVNGVPVPVQPDGSWSASLLLDPAEVFNPILAQMVRLGSPTLYRARRVVIAGESVAEGDYSLESIAMRFDDSGLDAIEPSVEDQVDLDLAAMLPVGTVVIQDFCAVRDPFFGFCVGWVDASVQNPPPTFSGFGIAIDSLAGFTAGDVAIQNARVDLFLAGSGLAPSCGLRVSAASTDVLGDYDLSPASPDPSFVDVNQVGLVSVLFSAFQSQFTSGLCDFPLIGDLIQLIIGDVEEDVRAGLEDFLQDPDGSGPLDGPIGDAIEAALAGIQIAGPLGQSLGVTLEAPFFGIDEDVDGMTFGSDGRVLNPAPLPGAPDLTASYHVDATFPTFGGLTPGGLSYGLGLAISTSAFNQLLRAETEGGLLRFDLTEIDLGLGPVPLTAGELAALIPQFGLLDPATPLRAEVRPTLAPLLTGAPGPGGEAAELRLGHLVLNLVQQDLGTLLLGAAADARVGLDFVFDDATASLSFSIGPVQTGDVEVDLLQNPLSVNVAGVENLLQLLLELSLPSLAATLGTFPLPTFLGLGLQGVEVGHQGQFLFLFLDLVPAP